MPIALKAFGADASRSCAYCEVLLADVANI